jgi:hypothetical protein
LNPRREVLATLLETDLEDPMVEKVYEKARLVPTCSTFRHIFGSLGDADFARILILLMVN